MTSTGRHRSSLLTRLIWIALAMSAGGCASRAYVTPVEGPRATLKYRLTSPVPEVRVYTLLDGQCAQRKWMGGLKSDASPGDKLQGELSVTIPASRPFYTEVMLDVSNATYCGVLWEFRPEEGGSYEAELSYANEKCDVKLFKTEAAGGAAPRRTELPSPPAVCT